MNDLIIVGGGLVGAGLAVALRDTDCQVTLIDERMPTLNDPRLFALNDTSCQFLKNIGLWQALAPDATPINTVHVSRQGGFGSVRLTANEVGLASLGHTIPAYRIETALNDVLTAQTNVTLYRPARLKNLTQQEDKARLILETNKGEVVLESSFVVGADGAESTVRRQLNIEATVEDYQQQAIVTRTKLQRSHQCVAYERFNATGAIAMLPLVGDECATIWSADNKTAAELMNLSAEGFLQKLQGDFGYRLGRLQAISDRHIFPLRQVVSKQTRKGAVMLLGNAAHALHPVAAQGFNLALYEVAVLAEALSTREVLDWNEIDRRINKQQAVSIGASNRLTHLFSTNSPWARGMLSLGLAGLDMIVPAKKKFVTRLMGRSGRVPSLLLQGTCIRS